MRATLIIGDMTMRDVEAVFLPKSPHDSLGPPGELIVPVYLKSIFGRDLIATLEVGGVGAFEVKLWGRHGADGRKASGSFEVLRAPAGWSPP
jgi:hypothetical protein